MRLGEIAERIGAVLEGNDAMEIRGVAALDSAAADEISFLSNPKYAAALARTRAGAVLLAADAAAPKGVSVLRVADPYLAFATVVELFYQRPVYPAGVHATAVVDPSATIGADAHIGPFCVVGAGAHLGAGAVLIAHVVVYPHVHAGARLFAHAHAVIREHCRLGDDVTLQNGAVVGGDGFGFAKDGDGRWTKIVQSGTVVLGDRVEMQANSCVDRASIGVTRVGNGTKIDNLVQVGHGSEVGENTLLCAQVGLAGSSKVGDRVILAGQVGVAGHCTIGDDAVATAQTGIPSNVAAKSVVSGYPAMDNRQWLRAVAAFHRLPEMVRELRALRRNEGTGPVS